MTQTLSIRFPNESETMEVQFNPSDFVLDDTFEDDVFGWYKGTYVAIKTTDYNAIII